MSHCSWRRHLTVYVQSVFVGAVLLAGGAFAFATDLPNTGTGLVGSYYASAIPDGTPALTRTDATVNFNWGAGSPAAGIPVDNFSARWEGELEPRVSEACTIILRTDDGVRAWLNGALVIDAWNLRGAADSTYTFTAVAGQHYPLRIEYFEHTGSAMAQLLWQSPSQTRQVIPSTQLYPVVKSSSPSGTGTGLLMTAYANEALAGAPVVTRTDPRIDVDWAGGSPASSVPADHFSVRWDGELQARYTESYTLTLRTDDGARMWLNGQLVVNDWYLRGAANSTYTFSASAGQRYRIRVEMYEHTGSASARLWWQSAHELFQPVPSSQLYPTPPDAVPVGSGTGLIASYFANETVTGTPVVSRTELRLDFDWLGKSPDAMVPDDSFSARWVGEIEPRFSEPYTLIARTDDGVRVWLDGALVIDAWKLRGAADSTYTFFAVAGQHHQIRVEYYEHTGRAVAQLLWQSAHEMRQPIPSSQLYPVPIPATVSLSGNLAATFNGNPVSVTASTVPAGLPVTLTYAGTITAPTNVGSFPVVATVVDPCFHGSTTGVLTIVPAQATIALNNVGATFDGQPHAVQVITTPDHLATTVTYAGLSTAPSAAGSYPVVATITDPDYQGVTNATLVITPAPATVVLSNVNATYDGQVHAVLATTIPPGLSVAITYGTTSIAPSTAGSYTVTGTITDVNYVGSTSTTLTIAQANPTVTWTPPSAITYGTPLSGSQLNATAELPGVFTYAPPLNSVLTAGLQTLSVTFVPTDSVDYVPVVSTVPLQIQSATPVITWPTPATMTVGTALSDTQLNASANVPGVFTYTPAAGTILQVGDQTLRVDFQPTDGVNYSTTSANTTVTLIPPVISTPATVTLDGLAATYDGQPHAAVATTVPAGLAVAITYNDGTNTLTDAPVAAGSYTVMATITEPGYAGTATVTEVITPAMVWVSMNTSVVAYDGMPHTADMYRTPGDVPMQVTYNGSIDPPVQSGSYEVVVTSLDPNYIALGNTTGTLVIGGIIYTDPAYTFITYAGSHWAGSSDGNGTSASFSYPKKVAIDGHGTTFVADWYNCAIRMIDSSGLVTTLAGQAGVVGSADGTGPDARFAYPEGIAVDTVGNVYVTDTGNGLIRKIAPGGVVTTLAGQAGVHGSVDGIGSQAQFSYPSGLAIDDNGNLYVADNATIRRVKPTGEVTTLAGQSGTIGSADGIGADARFSYAYGLTTDHAGNVYVADTGNSTIRKLTFTGGVTTVTTVAGQPGSYGILDGAATVAQFSFPGDVAVDSQGAIFVADSYSNTIRRISPMGDVTTVAGNSTYSGYADGDGPNARFNYPAGIAVDGNGILYVADANNNCIRVGSTTPFSAPIIIAQPVDQTVDAGKPVVFSIEVSGSFGLTYQWFMNGATIPDATSSTFTINAPTTADNGSYVSCCVTNVFGSAYSNGAMLTVHSTSPTVTVLGSTTLTVRASQGTVTFDVTLSDPAVPVDQLTLSASSDRADIVPSAGIAISGTGARRTVIVPLASGLTTSGSVTITVVASNGQQSASAVINLTVIPLVVSALPDLTIDENTTSNWVSFSLSAVDPATVLVSFLSNTPALVDASAIAVGGSGSQRQFRITPQSNQYGSAVITLRASDDGGVTWSAFRGFTLTVNHVNQPPYFVSLPNNVTVLDGVTSDPQQIRVDDDGLIQSVTATGNPGQLSQVTLTQDQGDAWNLTVVPVTGFTGTAVITLIAIDDEQAITSVTIPLTVVGGLPNPITVMENGSAGPLPFHAADGVTFSMTTSNNALLSPTQVVITGSGAVRWLQLSPVLHHSGTTSLTLTPSAGAPLSPLTTTVVVTPINQAPTISAPAFVSQTVVTGSSTAALPFTIADRETSADQLQVTVTSSNETVMPTSAITLGGSGAQRTLTITSILGVTGASTIALTVSDGSLSTQVTCRVTVVPVGVSIDPTLVVRRSAGTYTIPFTLGSATSVPMTLTLTKTLSATGTMPAEIADPVIDSAALVVPAGASTGQLTITFPTSTVPVPDQVLSLTLAGPGVTGTSRMAGTTQVTIANDVLPIPELSTWRSDSQGLVLAASLPAGIVVTGGALSSSDAALPVESCEIIAGDSNLLVRSSAFLMDGQNVDITLAATRIIQGTVVTGPALDVTLTGGSGAIDQIGGGTGSGGSGGGGATTPPAPPIRVGGYVQLDAGSQTGDRSATMENGTLRYFASTRPSADADPTKSVTIVASAWASRGVVDHIDVTVGDQTVTVSGGYGQQTISNLSEGIWSMSAVATVIDGTETSTLAVTTNTPAELCVVWTKPHVWLEMPSSYWQDPTVPEAVPLRDPSAPSITDANRIQRLGEVVRFNHTPEQATDGITYGNKDLRRLYGLHFYNVDDLTKDGKAGVLKTDSVAGFAQSPDQTLEMTLDGWSAQRMTDEGWENYDGDLGGILPEVSFAYPNPTYETVTDLPWLHQSLTLVGNGAQSSLHIPDLSVFRKEYEADDILNAYFVASLNMVYPFDYYEIRPNEVYAYSCECIPESWEFQQKPAPQNDIKFKLADRCGNTAIMTLGVGEALANSPKPSDTPAKPVGIISSTTPAISLCEAIGNDYFQPDSIIFGLRDSSKGSIDVKILNGITVETHTDTATSWPPFFQGNAFAIVTGLLGAASNDYDISKTAVPREWPLQWTIFSRYWAGSTIDRATTAHVGIIPEKARYAVGGTDSYRYQSMVPGSSSNNSNSNSGFVKVPVPAANPSPTIGHVISHDINGNFSSAEVVDIGMPFGPIRKPISKQIIRTASPHSSDNGNIDIIAGQKIDHQDGSVINEGDPPSAKKPPVKTQILDDDGGPRRLRPCVINHQPSWVLNAPATKSSSPAQPYKPIMGKIADADARGNVSVSSNAGPFQGFIAGDGYQFDITDWTKIGGGGYRQVAYGVNDYNGQYAVHYNNVWANVIALTPDIAATGSTTTLTLSAGFCDFTFQPEDFDPAAEYVQILNQDGACISQANESPSSLSQNERDTQIIITKQKFIWFDGRVQYLQLTCEIGSQVKTALLSVDVRCGAVKAYEDDLSAPSKGGTVNGGDSWRMKDALKVFKPDIVPTMPKYAECLKKRTGKADEPVIIMNNGGDKTVNNCSLIGHDEDGKNSWSFTAKYDSPVFIGDAGKYAVVWELGGGEITSGSAGSVQIGGTPTVVVKYHAGQFKPSLKVYRTFNGQTTLVGTAAIHTINVYNSSVDGTDWTTTPVTTDDRYGSECKLERKTDDGVGVNVRVGIDGKVKGSSRVRVSPDGYPQNEYWVTSGDTDDLPQPYAFKPAPPTTSGTTSGSTGTGTGTSTTTSTTSTQSAWVQGYGAPSSSTDDLSVRIKASKSYGDDATPATFTTLLQELALDYNRDHTITFDDADKTHSFKPYRFWLNDDHDVSAPIDDPVYGSRWCQQDVDPSTSYVFGLVTTTSHDYDNANIPWRRDLEDFFPVDQRLSGPSDAVATITNDSTVFPGLDAVSSSVGQVKVAHRRCDDATSYLTQADGDFSTGQTDDARNDFASHNGSSSEGVPDSNPWSKVIGAVDGTQGCAMPTDSVSRLTRWQGSSHTHGWLVEGSKSGRIGLRAKLTMVDPNTGSQIVIHSSVTWVDVSPVADWYWKISSEPANAGSFGGIPQPISIKHNAAGWVSTEADPVRFLHVHGYNMSPFDKSSFADTAFKRLWWNGFKGRFISYDWPTDYTLIGSYPSGLGDPFGAANGFAGSERIAWLAGDSLAAALPKLNGAGGTGPLNVFAHSQGNVVVTNALAQTSNVVNTYVASQAAVSSEQLSSKAGGDALATPIRLAYLNNQVQTNSLGQMSISPSLWILDFVPVGWLAGTNKGLKTPEMDLGFLASVPGAATRVNFYNQDDWALGTWVAEYAGLGKPLDDFPGNGWAYRYNRQNTPEADLAAHRGYGEPSGDILREQRFFRATQTAIGDKSQMANVYEPVPWSDQVASSAGGYYIPGVTDLVVPPASFLITGGPKGGTPVQVNVPSAKDQRRRQYDLMSFAIEPRWQYQGRNDLNLKIVNNNAGNNVDVLTLWKAQGVNDVGPKAPGESDFGQHMWHSGEYHSMIQEQCTYWGQVLTSMKLTDATHKTLK